jgi:hypothetical protein
MAQTALHPKSQNVCNILGYIEEEAWPGRIVRGGQGPILFAIKQSVKNKEK